MRRALVASLLVPTVQAQTVPRYLGDRMNALPPGLQEGWGLFAFNIVAWAIIAALVMLVVAPTLKAIAVRTPTDLDRRIVSIVSKPGFILIFTFGVVDSLSVFALPQWAFTTLDRMWNVVLVLVLTYVAYKVWREVILDVGKRVSAKTESQLDDQLYPLFDKVGGLIIILAGVWFVVQSTGVNMTLFAAGGAVGGLIIAFAAQDTLANFFAGVHILIDRPFAEGDRIEIKEEDTWGDVVDIGLRSTRIRTRDNRLVIVPNSVIATNSVINHSVPSTDYRIFTSIGVAYGTDIEHARKVLEDAVQAVEGVEATKVHALFRAFGASSLDFEVRYWIKSYIETRMMEDRVNTAIYNALNDAGIEIPFPQRVLWNGAQPEATVV